MVIKGKVAAALVGLMLATPSVFLSEGNHSLANLSSDEKNYLLNNFNLDHLLDPELANISNPIYRVGYENSWDKDKYLVIVANNGVESGYICERSNGDHFDVNGVLHTNIDSYLEVRTGYKVAQVHGDSPTYGDNCTLCVDDAAYTNTTVVSVLNLGRFNSNDSYQELGNDLYSLTYTKK